MEWVHWPMYWFFGVTTLSWIRIPWNSWCSPCKVPTLLLPSQRGRQSYLHLVAFFLMGMRGCWWDLQWNWVGEVVLLFWAFAIVPLGNGETLSTLSLPPLKTRPPQCQRRGAVYIDIASPVGIGQRKHYRRVCSCLVRGEGKIHKEYRGVLVYLLTTTTLGFSESHWLRAKNASEASILDWW